MAEMDNDGLVAFETPMSHNRHYRPPENFAHIPAFLPVRLNPKRDIG
jgi:hypothetical protein